MSRAPRRWQAAPLLLLSLIGAACSTADPARPLTLEPEKSFSLCAGSSAQTPDGALRIGFDGVTTDSRCAKNEQCVWAGDAVARVWLQPGTGPREQHALHTAPGATQAVRRQDHELRLISLDPAPVAGGPAAKRDYVATLIWRRSAAAEAER